MALFPALPSSNCTTNLPFVRKAEFLTTGVDMETGWRISYAWRTLSLLRWELEYTNVSDADLPTHVDFFEARGGRYEEFQFVDPENSSFTHNYCRFDMDELQIRRTGPNENHYTLIIQEYSSPTTGLPSRTETETEI